jgi:hypothetical protein
MASRRAVLAGVAAAAFAGPAPAEERLVDPKKVFVYFDAYLRIPPAKRNAITVVYRFTATRPAGLWIVEGTQRTPLPLSADGRVLRLPTAGQMEAGKLLVSGPDKAKYSLNIGVEPVAPPAQEMDAAPLALSINQATEAMKTAAGPLALVAPRLKRVGFTGVASGEAVLADGRRVPLPVDDGAPYYEPGKLPGARTLRFPKTPTRITVG